MPLRLPQRLTIVQARSASRELLAHAQGAAAMHIDASDLVEFDSAALALLLQARRLAQARGLAFELSGMPDKLVQLAGLYGVQGLLGLRDAA